MVGVEGVRGAVDILFTNEDLEYTVAKVQLILQSNFFDPP